MSRLLVGMVLLATACGSPANSAGSTTTHGPNVVALDESLIGQTPDALMARLGTPCVTTTDSQPRMAWWVIHNTVVACSIPTDEQLTVQFRDGLSIGYYIGTW